MRIGLARVYPYGILEALNRLGSLAALLVDQSELILGVSVMWVQSGCFKHAAEMLAAAHARSEVGEFAAEIIEHKTEHGAHGEEHSCAVR